MKLQYYLRGLGIGILVTAMIFCILPGEKEALSDAEIRARALELGMVESSSLTLADVQNKQETEADKKESDKKESEEQQETVGSQETQQAGTDNKQEASSAEGAGAATESAGAENQGAGNEGAAAENTGAGNQGTVTENQGAGNTGTDNTGTGAENNETENVVTGVENTGTENPGTTEVPQQDTVSGEADADVIKITVAGGAHSYTVAQKLEEMQLVEDAKEFDEYLCNNGYSRYIRVGTHKIPKGSTWEEIAKIISGK